MNKITRKSFYSFLTLYIVSSFTLLFSTSYWFYSSQMAQQQSNDYYQMRMIVDSVSAKIAKAHMMKTEFILEKFEFASVSAFDKEKNLLYGHVIQHIDFDKNRYMKDNVFVVIARDPSLHLGVSYIVAQSTICSSTLNAIRGNIMYTTIFIALFILVIAVILSNIFLRPVKDKMLEIDQFVKDTTHELNTPITALMMSTSRIKDKKIFDARVIQNISISTKQLYDIYSSLSFLSFDTKSEESINIRFDLCVKESLSYFSELLDKKHIHVEFIQEPCNLLIAPTKSKMLINNLISNAIKYSHPNTNIKVTVSQEKLLIKDEGIGIEKDKLDSIFKRFTRANTYAGGFGVGLNIVESIIKEYKYKINIKSELNKGTQISIFFNS